MKEAIIVKEVSAIQGLANSLRDNLTPEGWHIECEPMVTEIEKSIAVIREFYSVTK